ncbi:sulfotransferase domain-containing protein [Rubrobacter calidifluminis]|uniref:sulfotransferase domain-containing protein n=1 Tax=Rubrobacter calidifluminis TaxID=1392640 RepID=UPI00235F15AC|nr:sulfotransferase domain-containing protein [Rubrobacter calidifluminis]
MVIRSRTRPAGAVSGRGLETRVLANSIPKSGTHLLLRLLILLGFEHFQKGIRRDVLSGSHPLLRRLLRAYGSERVPVGIDFPEYVSRRWLEGRLGRVPEGAVVSAHCVYSPGFAGILREQGFRVVCILRDPRDTALSHMYYLKSLPRHPAYREYMSLPGDHERLMFSIRGGRLGRHVMRSLEERYRGFMEWEEEGGALMVRFEDLVGPKGGGSGEAQRRTVVRVAGHLGIRLDDERVEEICEGLFGAGRTFRRGRRGGWREEFSAEHVEAVKEVAGDLLVDLGYERDRRW